MKWFWTANECIGLCRLLPSIDVAWDDMPRLLSVEVGWLRWAAQLTIYADA